MHYFLENVIMLFPVEIFTTARGLTKSKFLTLWFVAKNALLRLPRIHLCGQVDLESKETPHLASDLVVEVGEGECS